MRHADESEVIDRASALLDGITRHVDLLTFNPDLNIKHVAICAAGLGRALALVDAIGILEDNDREDVTGNLLRAVLETHHVALYALLGGNEAIEALRADHSYHVGGLV